MNTPSRIPAVSVTFHRANGEECPVNEHPEAMRLTFAGGNVTTVTRGELTPLAEAFMWHGAKQKFIDAAAISRNPETGRSATADDKMDAVLEVIERCVVAHQWNKAREGGGAGTLLLEALCRVYAGKRSRVDLVAFLEGKTPEERRALERNARIAPVIEAIRTERRLAAGTGADGEDLLADLD